MPYDKKFDITNAEYYQVKENELLDGLFESDIDEFTEYYRIEYLYDVREKLVCMYLIKFNEVVLGYVTLTMTHIRSDATKKIEAKEVNENIPALLISHLAVHKDFQRRGIGSALLDLIFELVPQLEKFAGCRYVMLNPRNDQNVRDFYTAYGFDYYNNFKSDKESDAFLMDLKFPK